MTTEQTIPISQHDSTVTEDEVAGAPPPAANPLVVGLPAFIVGALSLGLVLTGFVPAAAVGASLPIILAATSVGLIIAAVWAASLGQNVVASFSGILSGFWFSYAVLVLGLTHNWFGISASAAKDTQELFLVSWLVLIVVLTLATLRLPTVYTVLLLLVDIALLLLLIATVNSSTGVQHAAGWFVFAFGVAAAYLFVDALSTSTGGSELPLGPPVLK